MGQTTDQIASGIHQTRDALKSNLEELETRVKSAVDWRNQFRRHPVAMIAVVANCIERVVRLAGSRNLPPVREPNPNRMTTRATSMPNRRTSMPGS